ncbi:glycoside hydrolase family 16 protein [Ceratobasidium sp. AG-Ba]|nr:glycoside hydrolase family 16 protein [Ceratobasidium sp. AG-Ba]
MAQQSDRPASYGPVPTSPNSPNMPVGDPSRLQSTPAARTPSAYVSSPLNPNAPTPMPTGRSRPPSAGSSALQAEFADLHSREGGKQRRRPTQHPQRACVRPQYPLRAVNHRFSTMSSAGSILSFASDSKYPVYAQNNGSNGGFAEGYPYHGDSPDMWAPLDDGPEDDDAMHEPDPKGHKEKLGLSGRGCFNVGMLLLVIGALLALFISYPIVHYVQHGSFPLSNLVNGTGQVADLPNLPNLIDKDTPDSAKTRTGFDGQQYELVFSDEFNVDGRSFYPGDDPFWEAVDLNYWATKDLEWYDPGNVQTQGGNLVITLESVLNHDLNYRSGMLQSWNKFCFTNGYIEFNMSLPGEANVAGYWPGAWIMGNLGRPGYGGTTDGVWPYTYDACDIGTFPNQTRKDGTPTTNANGGTKKYNYQLSVLPGQKLSACTCPDTPSSEHPGPTMNTGRGAPEIDALEAQKNKLGDGGKISDPSITAFNEYRGSAVQQAVSALTTLPEDIYEQTQGNFQTGKPSLSMTAGAVGPDAMAEISNRLVPEEPMAIVMNLAISESFQRVDVANMVFPSHLKIDYVRVYQRKGEKNVGCDPRDYPTSQYIADHLDVYTNANITKWPYGFPKNSLYDGCD